jgi:very-short-patch-repair endonuclease/restriction endonuclease S subunit
MPNNWKTYKLGEISAKVVTGGTPLTSIDEYYKDGKIPWLKTKEVNFCKIYETEYHISKEGLAKSSAKLIPANSVIIAMYGQGDTAGRVAVNKIPLATNQACCNLIIDIQKADYRFVYYYLKRSYAELVSRKTGSAQPNLNTKIVKDFEVVLPPLPEQRAIASILSSLDDKIELNLQMNKALEEMAMTLYKHWFVDFEFPSGEGWPQAGVVNSPPQEGSPKEGVVRNTANYMSLPYNPKLKQRAKELRKAGNLAEVLFWQEVKNKQFKGLDFDRQKIIGNYIVDFYCANVNLVLEIDGSSHDDKQEYDAKRDAYLEGLGLTVIHIADGDVLKNLTSTMNYLWDHPAFSPPPEGWSKTGVINAPLLEEYLQGEDVNDHPAFQAPLQRRGMGYRSSGGKFVDSELGLIPEGWEVKRLGEFSKNKQYGYTQSSSLEEIGPKFLRITDIQGGTVEWNNVPYCSVSDKDLIKYRKVICLLQEQATAQVKIPLFWMLQMQFLPVI